MSDTKGKIITCRAAVAWETGKPISIEEIQVTPPKTREIRIKMIATGVCHTDISGWQSNMPFSKMPIVLGHEGAGIVESVGAGVDRMKEGDHVLVCGVPRCQDCAMCQVPNSNACAKYFVNREMINLMHDGTSRYSCKGKLLHTFMRVGTYSQYTVVDDAYAIKVNKAAPLDKIFLISCGIPTGYGSAVNTAQVKRGSTCVVFGLGTVGMAVVMGCKAQGAGRIIGVDINKDKQEIAKTFGVTEFINPSDYEKSMEQVISEKTRGGCDYAFECTGIIDVAEASFKSCRIGGGMCIIIGAPPIGLTMKVDPEHLLDGRTLKGCIIGDYTIREFPELVDLYMKKKIMLDEFITTTLPIEEINKAFGELGKGASIKTRLLF